MAAPAASAWTTRFASATARNERPGPAAPEIVGSLVVTGASRPIPLTQPRFGGSVCCHLVLCWSVEGGGAGLIRSTDKCCKAPREARSRQGGVSSLVRGKNEEGERWWRRRPGRGGTRLG